MLVKWGSAGIREIGCEVQGGGEGLRGLGYKAQESSEGLSATRGCTDKRLKGLIRLRFKYITNLLFRQE
jgi:hypothetical protein